MKVHSFARLGLVCAGAGLMLAALHGEDVPSGPAVLRCDLNGDGRPESITWRKLSSDTETGIFYQIIVKTPSGEVLWKSPEVAEADNAMAFGEWHFGISIPELAGDIDNDGKAELLAPAPQSDVSPTFFRVFQWTGRAFEPRQTRALTGRGHRGASFNWTQTPSHSDFWVQRWLGSSPDGGWVVELVTLPEGGDLRTATGVILAKGDGFELLRWIQPPTQPRATEGNGGARDANVIYRARLSSEDHVNSSGTPLKKVADILRQDRANYHRGLHRDTEDQDDGRFAAAETREALASMPVTVRGGEKAEERILHGTPLVEVKISAGAVQVEILKD